MRRVIALLALAGAVALVASGCGGGGGGNEPLTKADYEQQMSAIGKSLTDSLNSLGTATSAAAAATVMKKLQAELEDAADKMNAITPPERVKTEHGQLVEGVRQFGEELGPIITKLEGGDLQAVAGVQSLAGVAAIQKASSAINGKGFNISSSG
jgi:hypothetical protein